MKFEDEWARLKRCRIYDSFTFNGASADWNSTVREHFKSKGLTRPAYGVYVVRQKSTNKVIYIGKSGTMNQDGTLREQDLEKRLVANENHKPRKIEFGKRVSDYDELLIEYVILNPQKLVPGYAEARLLQAFFSEHRCLPPGNASL